MLIDENPKDSQTERNWSYFQYAHFRHKSHADIPMI